MSRTLTDRQIELVERRVLIPVPLIRLTTYLDRSVPTINSIHYWSDRTIMYGGNEYDARAIRIDRQVESIPHIPAPSDALLSRRLTFVLRDGPTEAGPYLVEVLQNEFVILASVEIDQLLLYSDELSLSGIDSLSGDEHIPFFRGNVIRQLGPRDNEITIVCEAELPDSPQLVMPQTAAPKDRGKVVPIVYGQIERLPLLNALAGAQTTLAAELKINQTTIELTDADDFPASGTAIINNENVTYTGKTGNTLTGVARNLDASYAAGTAIIQSIPAMRSVVGQKGCTPTKMYIRNRSLDALYNPANMPFIVDQDDESVFGAGRGVTTVTIVGTDFDAAIKEATQAGNVTQQPDFELTNNDPTITYEIIHAGTSQNTLNVTGWNTVPDHIWDVDDSPGFNGTPEAPVYKDLGTTTGNEFYLASQWTQLVGDTRQVARVRAVQTFDHEAISGAVNIALDSFQTVCFFNDEPAGVDIPQLNAFKANEWIDNGDGTFDMAPFSVTVEGPWQACPVGTTVEDFRFTRQDLYLRRPNASEPRVILRQDEWGLEFELTDQIGLNRKDDAQIDAFGGGIGLDLYADVTGPLSPGAPYWAGAGVVISRLADVVRHYLTEICGVPASDIDDASFADNAVQVPNDYAFWLNQGGTTLAELLGPALFEGRSQLVQAEEPTNTVWRLLQADWDGAIYRWPAAVEQLADNEWTDIEEIGRVGENIATAFRLLYDPDYSRSGEDSYEGVAEATPESSDLSRIQASGLAILAGYYGRRTHPGFVFDGILDASALDDVGSYYIRANTSALSTFRIDGIPWTVAYDLVRGDIIEFRPPWRSAAIEARIIQTEKSWVDHTISLIVVELY